jgi:hypothetical protein
MKIIDCVCLLFFLLWKRRLRGFDCRMILQERMKISVASSQFFQLFFVESRLAQAFDFIGIDVQAHSAN